MNNRTIFTALGVMLLAGPVGLFLVGKHISERSNAQQPTPKTDTTGSPQKLPPNIEKKQESTKTAQAWGEEYQRADEKTKRRILERLEHAHGIQEALFLALATVGDDPRAPEDDPMVNEVAHILLTHYKTPDDLHQARRILLLQKSDKRRWVVAHSAIEFAKEVTPNSPFHAQKTRLSGKLVDLHRFVKNTFVQHRLVEGLHQLGSQDAALILAQDGNIEDSQLLAVRTNIEARQKSLPNRKPH